MGEVGSGFDPSPGKTVAFWCGLAGFGLVYIGLVWLLEKGSDSVAQLDLMTPLPQLPK